MEFVTVFVAGLLAAGALTSAVMGVDPAMLTFLAGLFTLTAHQNYQLAKIRTDVHITRNIFNYNVKLVKGMKIPGTENLQEID